jgi:hypothetical protein
MAEALALSTLISEKPTPSALMRIVEEGRQTSYWRPFVCASPVPRKNSDLQQMLGFLTFVPVFPEDLIWPLKDVC